MSIDSADLVDNALDEQARRNAAFIDQPGANDLITDFFPIYPIETIGFQTEAPVATSLTLPHLWGDPPTKTQWGFFEWGESRQVNSFQLNAFEDDAFQIDVETSQRVRWGNRAWGDGVTSWGN